MVSDVVYIALIDGWVQGVIAETSSVIGGGVISNALRVLDLDALRAFMYSFFLLNIRLGC